MAGPDSYLADGDDPEGDASVGDASYRDELDRPDTQDVDPPLHRGLYDWDDRPEERDGERHSRGLDFGLLMLRLGPLALLPHGVHQAVDLDAFTRQVETNVVGAQAPEFIAWMIMMSLIGLPLLIAVGLFTRPAGFLCAALLACIFALAILPRLDYQLVDEAGALTGESAVLFVALTLPLAFTGAGRWSLDAMRTAGRP